MSLFGTLGTGLGTFFGGPLGGVVGGFLGGALDKKQSSNSNAAAAVPDMYEQQRMQLEHERQSFTQKMKMGKELGMHPLTMLGVPVSSVNPVISSGNLGASDWSSSGAGASQIASAFATPEAADKPELTPEQQTLQELGIRRARADTERAEWDALQAQFKTQDMASQSILRGQPGNPPGVRMSNDKAIMTGLAAAQSGLPPSAFSGGGIDIKQEILPPHPLNLGHAAGMDQGFKSYMDLTGRPQSLVNQDAISAEVENFGATFNLLASEYGLRRALQIVSGLELAPLVGGMGAAGLAGYGAYKHFFPNEEPKKPNTIVNKNRPYKPGWGKGAPSRPNYRQPF